MLYLSNVEAYAALPCGTLLHPSTLRGLDLFTLYLLSLSGSLKKQMCLCHVKGTPIPKNS